MLFQKDWGFFFNKKTYQLLYICLPTYPSKIGCLLMSPTTLSNVLPWVNSEKQVLYFHLVFVLSLQELLPQSNLAWLHVCVSIVNECIFIFVFSYKGKNQNQNNDKKKKKSILWEQFTAACINCLFHCTILSRAGTGLSQDVAEPSKLVCLLRFSDNHCEVLTFATDSIIWGLSNICCKFLWILL